MIKLNQTTVRLLLLENFFPKSSNLFTKSNLNCNFVRVLQIFLNYYLNRISAGIHTGGVVAGIVGSKMPRYIVLFNFSGYSRKQDNEVYCTLQCSWYSRKQDAEVNYTLQCGGYSRKQDSKVNSTLQINKLFDGLSSYSRKQDAEINSTLHCGGYSRKQDCEVNSTLQFSVYSWKQDAEVHCTLQCIGYSRKQDAKVNCILQL